MLSAAPYMTLSLSHVQAAQAAHARRFRPLPTIKDKAAGPGRPWRDSTGAPSPTKAVSKQPAFKLSAAKPNNADKVKSRPGDVVIDLVSGVLTTTIERNIPGPSSPPKAVRDEPNVSAERTK